VLDFFPDARKIHEALKFQRPLALLTTSYLVDPVLMQDLTILKERLPKYFRKTLFCTWFSVLLATELGCQADVRQDIFLAGLSHDIGFLRIAESHIRKTQPLTTQRWRAIQSHVLLGSLLLEKLYGRDSGAARAVLEHHERNDGSGYPFGKTNETLDIASQVTGLSDMIQAIRIDRFESKARNLRDISPCLKINSTRIGKELYEVTHSILSRSGLPYSCSNPHGGVKKLVDVLSTRSIRLREALLRLQEFDEPIRISTEIGKRTIETSMLFVKETVRTSGISSEDIVNWLIQLQRDPSTTSLEELTELEIMQDEICWHLDKLYRVIHHEIGAGERNDPSMERLSEISKKIFGTMATA